MTKPGKSVYGKPARDKRARQIRDIERKPRKNIVLDFNKKGGN